MMWTVLTISARQKNGNLPKPWTSPSTKLARYDGSFWKELKMQLGFVEPKNTFLDTITFGWTARRKAQRIAVNRRIEQMKRGDLIGVRAVILPDSLPPIMSETILDGDFKINGRNETRTIKNLERLTGLSIRELEQRMWEDKRTFDQLKDGEYCGSTTGGFLKDNEGLLEVTARDNKYVLQAGLTHQQVAKPLYQILIAYFEHHPSAELYFDLNGSRFRFSVGGFPMFQDSPFNDGISTPGKNCHIRKMPLSEEPKHTVGNIEVDFPKDERSFSFAILHPFLISRYGFYEGSVSFRIEPREIIEFFNLSGKND